MQVLKAIGVVLLLLVTGLVVWGFSEPRLLDVEYEDATIDGLPVDWDGRRVAVLADWQIGLWGDNEGTIQRAVERTIAERPDVVLLAGDFIYHPGTGPEADEELRSMTILAEQLTRAGLPVYAVLGNHDYLLSKPTGTPDYSMAARVERGLEQVGVDVLHNEAVRLPSPARGAAGSADPLYLVGIGSKWADRARPDEALAKISDDMPRLVMMHNPDTFGRLPPSSAPLAVAGHTHGGQVRLPGFPEASWLSFVRTEQVHSDGWIEDYGAPGNQLYVNRGIGMSMAPVRINCMPELTLITLHRGASYEVTQAALRGKD